MRKMRLEIDGLEVQSFATGSGAIRGTVGARENTEWNCGWTQDQCIAAEGGDPQGMAVTQGDGRTCRYACGSCSCQDTCQTCAPAVCPSGGAPGGTCPITFWGDSCYGCTGGSDPGCSACCPA